MLGVITRNLGRAASSRGFSNATMWEKSEFVDKLKKSTTQWPNVPNRQISLFTKLESGNDPTTAASKIAPGIACDDEILKVIKSLSLTDKVRLFSRMAQREVRNIPALETLASTISSHPTKLDLQECSDLLHAMLELHFGDEMLLSRISINLNDKLDENQDKNQNIMAVVASIVTSIGKLKYKDPILLDNLIKWTIKNEELCRPKDWLSLIATLANVHYHSKYVNDVKKEILPKINQDELSCSQWLDFVWALCVLELHQPEQLETVLRPEFFEGVIAEVPHHRLPVKEGKLLIINAVAKILTVNYNGPFLKPGGSVYNYHFVHGKRKTSLIQGLSRTLQNLATNNSNIRIEHNSELDFIIDAKCLSNESRDSFRVALVVLDTHEKCRGQTNDPSGFYALAIKLLQKSGYHVLEIPCNEFGTYHNVSERVHYLDSKLKNIVNK